jgi:hypothetical protein
MAEPKIPNYENLSVAKVEAELNTEFQSLKSGYDAFKSERLKMYREYKFQPYGNEVAGQSTIVDSSIWDAIEWMVPTMIQPFVETGNFIKIRPEEADMQSMIRAKAHRELLNYQVKKKSNWYQTLYDSIKGMLIQREAFAKLAWQEKDQKKGEPVSRPIITPTPAAQIRYDWTVLNFLDSHVVTQEEDLTRADIIELMKGADGLIESCFEKAIAEPGRNFKTARLQDEVNDQPNWVGNNDDKMDKNHTLYLRREHWTTYSLDGGDTVVPVMAVFIDDKLVQLIKNPLPIQRPPFFQCECVRDVLGNPAQSWSEVLSDIQKYKTGILRLTSDNLNAQMNGMIEFDQNNVDDIGVQLLQHAPKGSRIPIPVNKIGSVNPLPVIPIAGHAFTTWELLEVAKENRSGFTRYSQGLDSKSLNQTATGIVAITSRSEMRMWELTKRFGEMFLKPLARSIIAYNQEFLEPQDLELQFGSDEFRYEGPEGTIVIPARKAGDWLHLSKKDLGGYFSLEIDVDVGADKQQKIDNAFQWAQFFGPSVGQGIPPEAMSIIGLSTAKLMGIDEIELLMKKEVQTIGGGGVTVPAIGPEEGGIPAQAPGGEAGLGQGVPGLEGEQGIPEGDIADLLGGGA